MSFVKYAQNHERLLSQILGHILPSTYYGQNPLFITVAPAQPCSRQTKG